MTLAKTLPIGRVWTRVLQIVDRAHLITTEGVAVALRPPAPGQLWPPQRDLGYALNMLVRMRARGYVRLARPWAPGRLWAVDEDGEGRRALERLANPPPRRYRSERWRRRRSKRRRNELRAEGLCINGRNHGRAVRGCRCEACYDVHRGVRPGGDSRPCP